VTAGRIKHTEIVQRMQGLDAQRLLHSKTVCAKALVHAGLSVAQAEKVSAEIYEQRAPGDEPDAPVTPASPTGRPVMPTSPASSTAGTPRVPLSPRELSRASSLERSFGSLERSFGADAVSPAGSASSGSLRERLSLLGSGSLDTSLEDALLRPTAPSSRPDSQPPPTYSGSRSPAESSSFRQPLVLPERPLARLNMAGGPAGAPDRGGHSASFSPGPITCPPPPTNNRPASPFPAFPARVGSPNPGPSQAGRPTAPSGSLRVGSGALTPPPRAGPRPHTEPSSPQVAAVRSPTQPRFSPPRPGAAPTGVPSAKFSPMRPPAPSDAQQPASGKKAPPPTVDLKSLGSASPHDPPDSPTSPSPFPAGKPEEDDWK